MRKIAIIPARGGSKRIPRKNVKPFLGKPMLAYSVEAAVSSGVFDEVMVSTDDKEIARVAIEYGAKVPFMREAELANDFATANDVVMATILEYEKRGQRFDIGALVFPTAPFVTGEKLRQAARLLEQSDADAVVAVTAFSYPPQRAMVVKDGRLVFEYPEYLDTRSQDLEPHYHDAGQFIVFRVEPYKKNGRLLQGNILPYVLPETQVQDIDTEVDWEMAEMKYRLCSR